jgi:hypothetical protein
MSIFGGVLGTHQVLLNVVIPLWLVEETDAPRVLLAWLFGTNTVLCIFLPAYTSRGVVTLSDALRSVRIAGVFFVAASLDAPDLLVDFDAPVFLTVDFAVVFLAVEGFLAAVLEGDLGALMEVLDPDVVWRSDGGGKVTAARRVVRGADRIARMLVGIEAKWGHPFTYRLAHLNGEPAVVQYARGRLFGATFIETDGERVTALYRVMNPEKLRWVE